jgi:hypothetical protein
MWLVVAIITSHNIAATGSTQVGLRDEALLVEALESSETCRRMLSAYRVGRDYV